MSIISKLKISKCGPNVLPTKVLIKVKHLTEPISFLVNEYFACGIFPDILKSAIITPVFKKDHPLIVSNYRRISVLHWLSVGYLTNPFQSVLSHLPTKCHFFLLASLVSVLECRQW